MPYKIDWHVENRIIQCEVYGEFTLEEVRELSQAITERIRQGQAPVHVVVDPTQVEKYPLNIAAIKAVVQKPEPNAGWILLISTNTVIRFIMTMVVQMSGAHFRMSPDLKQALMLLQRVDGTLGELVPDDYEV
ncbi:MAG TPA: hypothetical protein VHL11_14020 [Phototrophicaceae bacterium]|jgi:hypothetical protein|nr:hypothetical protein [Phototrophicaceae bacterium]